MKKGSASWRVRIALEMKGIAYEYKPIDLIKDEQVIHIDKSINHDLIHVNVQRPKNKKFKIIVFREILETKRKK